MKILLNFVLVASLFVVSAPVFSAETLVQNMNHTQEEKKQYFFCAQTPILAGFNVVMSGIFIVEDTNETPSRTLEKVREYCKKEFGEDRVVVTVFNRIDQ